MYEFDATNEQIEELQDELLKKGITKEMLNLSNYAGLTYSELKNMVNHAYLIPKK